MLALVGSPATAQERLALAWGGCLAGGGATDVVFACGSLDATATLVCTMAAPIAVDSVIGAVIVMDVQSAASTLPHFWEFGSGGCNDGRLTASPPAPGACADAWNGRGSALVQDVIVGQPYGAASQVRIKAVISVPGNQAVRIEKDLVYEAIRLDFLGDRSGVCGGCIVPACLVLNSVRLIRLPGAADVVLEGDFSPPDNRALWRGGSGADCLAVPARPRSWGSLKVIYR